MILFPAIDLKDGQCVRLKLGDMSQSTVFNDEPAAQARKFSEAGCKWLHIVDLNGAFEGKPINVKAIKSVLEAVDIPVQLGGGIRDLPTIENWLSHGVRRVILGTAAVKNPELVKEACHKWPGRVAVGIDAKDGLVAVEGWAEVSAMVIEEIAERFWDVGVDAIIHTDINRDGILAGLNVDAVAAFAASTPIPVIASGGVSSLDDLLMLRKAGNIRGVICGRAIYEGRINLPQALYRLGN